MDELLTTQGEQVRRPNSEYLKRWREIWCSEKTRLQRHKCVLKDFSSSTTLATGQCFIYTAYHSDLHVISMRKGRPCQHVHVYDRTADGRRFAQTPRVGRQPNGCPWLPYLHFDGALLKHASPQCGQVSSRLQPQISLVNSSIRCQILSNE